AAARPPAAAPPAAAAPTGPPLFAAPAAPAADAAPVDDGNGDGRRRPGLARWLTTSSPRPSFPVPEGSPLDGGHAASRGGAPSTPPAGSPRPPADEPDLFRPVVEPQVPVRSPATLPSRPGAGRSPAPAPAAPMPAPAARAVPAAAPAPAPAPARPAVTPPPRPPEQVEPPPAAPPRPLAPAPEPGGPAPVGRPERGGRLGRGRGRDPREQHPGFTPAAGVPASPQARPVADGVQEWVRALLEHRSELFGVGETAQVLADEVIERAEADATAVLVPDGDRWRVSGGVGLRPLERRLLLDTTHWLISEIAVGGRALLIEDTDIVRPRLAGAPLAAWRHILAVPVPPIRAAVVLARGQEAARFTETDLAAVVPLVAEAGPLLQAALRMRELARALGPLRDLDG
ncbi:MAG TPA: hypothetical protein VE781_12515, partial [Kineosporiaceae bacterium]|nr:hypothetical protein [Kineosporiaceae bacterium]